MPDRTQKLKRIRVFTSLGFPAEAVDEVVKIQDGLRAKKLFNGSWTKSKNLHLTLKFLGEVEVPVIDRIKAILNQVEFTSFDMELNKLGFFADRKKKVRIVWIHVSGEDVVRLQQNIDRALDDQFPRDHRFMSHLTIARVKNASDNDSLIHEISTIPLKPVKFKVRNFSLMRSTLSSSGPVYDVLDTYPARSG